MKKSKLLSFVMALGVVASLATCSSISAITYENTVRTSNGSAMTCKTAIYGANLVAGTYTNVQADFISVDILGTNAYMQSTNSKSISSVPVWIGGYSFNYTVAHKVSGVVSGNKYVEFQASR